MDTITKSDIILINNLSSRTYTGNSLLSNATQEEHKHLAQVKKKLESIAEYFSLKYNNAYGPFETSVSSGNPIAVGGTKFNHVWSGLFKGASNKQYAAQISFVMNPSKLCLDVGYYFVAASGRKISKTQRKTFEQQLNSLGISLSNAIANDLPFRMKYNALFDFGFNAFCNDHPVTADEWHTQIRSQPKNSHIIAEIYSNDFDIIENSTIDLFVSQVIFLMGSIRDTNLQHQPIQIKPLTPEQMAKHAERLAQIGLKGELFVMKYEQKRLKDLGIISTSYPEHVALDFMNLGYDIVSIDKNSREVFIEVKTTTRSKEDNGSKKFFLSSNEYDVFSANKQKYKLYRVYDIEKNPSIDILDLGSLHKIPDGYIVEY